MSRDPTRPVGRACKPGFLETVSAPRSTHFPHRGLSGAAKGLRRCINAVRASQIQLSALSGPQDPLGNAGH